MKDNFKYPYFNKKKLSAFEKSKCGVQKKIILANMYQGKVSLG